MKISAKGLSFTVSQESKVSKCEFDYMLLHGALYLFVLDPPHLGIILGMNNCLTVPFRLTGRGWHILLLNPTVILPMLSPRR